MPPTIAAFVIISPNTARNFSVEAATCSNCKQNVQPINDGSRAVTPDYANFRRIIIATDDSGKRIALIVIATKPQTTVSVNASSLEMSL